MSSFWDYIKHFFRKNEGKPYNFDCKCCQFDEKAIIMRYIRESNELVENIIKIIALDNKVIGFRVDEKLGKLTIRTVAGSFSFAVKVDDQIRAAAALCSIGQPRVFITHTESELTFQILLDRWEYWFTAIPSRQFVV